MTSSARARIRGGIVRPSARAVLMLTTSSSLVACSTGRSAGFGPLMLRARKKTAALGDATEFRNGGNPIFQQRLSGLPRVAGERLDWLDVHAINSLACDGGDGRLELVAAPHREWVYDETKPARNLLCLGKAPDNGRVVGVEHQPYSGR